MIGVVVEKVSVGGSARGYSVRPSTTYTYDYYPIDIYLSTTSSSGVFDFCALANVLV